MKSKDLYRSMIKHRAVWVTFPLPYGTLRKCQIKMVGSNESLLKSDGGLEFTTSNRNISDERPESKA